MAADLADKAARNGASIVLAAKGNQCAVLVSYSNAHSTSSTSSDDDSAMARLMEKSRADRVRLLDSSTVMASVGLVADANYLADNLFEEITQHKFVFGSNLPVVRLAKTLSIMAHSQTLQRNSRPFGIHSCLIGLNSYDHASRKTDDPWGIYEVDVLGNIFPCKYTCLGPLDIAAKIAKELNKAGDDLDRTTEATKLLKQCIGCLQRGLASKRDEEREQEHEGEGDWQGESGRVRSHRLQVALLTRSSLVRILGPDELETLLSAE